jgi:glucose/mannose-6-phosphate isomerase
MTSMLDLIAELPAQLRWAAAAEVPRLPAADEGLVLGMGGSGFAGDVAAAFTEGQGRRVMVHKGYGLPGWAVRVAPTVVAVSHSGNTEETISGVEAAHQAGLSLVVTATGGRLQAMAADRRIPFLAVPPGPQPRAAAGYLAGGVLRILEAAGVLTGTMTALEEAAAVVESLLAGPAHEVATEVSGALAGRITVIYGSGPLTATAAGRWKTQINENGKSPAWWSLLPELDHNEIVGWGAHSALADHLGVVFLEDPDEHPRVKQRADLTAELMTGIRIAGRVAARGAGPLARLFSLVVVGDLVSVLLAQGAGIDPVPVAVIEELKKRLAEAPS